MSTTTLLNQQDDDSDRRDDQHKPNNPQPTVASPAAKPESCLDHGWIQHDNIKPLWLPDSSACFNRARDDLSRFDQRSIEFRIAAMSDQRRCVRQQYLERDGLLIAITVLDANVNIDLVRVPVFEVPIEAVQGCENAWPVRLVQSNPQS